MKFATCLVGSHRAYGVVQGDMFLRLDTVPGAAPDLKALLPGIAAGHEPDLRHATAHPIAGLRLLPPIPDPAKILCVAGNFRDGARADPAYPLVFGRYPDSVTGHNAPLLKPAVSDRFDFEGEMAVIIGRPGHRIARAAAMAHVAGFACFNDGSVRDWQKHSSQFTPGKNFPRSGSFGPWMVSRGDIPDPAALRLCTRVNGVVRQEAGLDEMIFDTEWLIEYISSFTPLMPGDVIVTGTPTGFGVTRTPPEFLRPGDRVDIGVTGLGTLSNVVMQDDDPRAEQWLS